MSFKENLRKKIQVDRLTDKVIHSMGPSGSERHIDKPVMRTLLNMAGFQSRTERDLEMYATDFSKDKSNILLLDNEMKIYDTTVPDVELRKNPTTKEMISIRNIRKILNDKDVVVSMGPETVKKVRHRILADLDLSFVPEDIEGIAMDGATALAARDKKEVMAALDLFAELLHLAPPPKAATVADLKIYAPQVLSNGEPLEYGPIYTYDQTGNTLHKYDIRMTPINMHKADAYKELVYGETDPELEGDAVFDDLQRQTLEIDRNPVPID